MAKRPIGVTFTVRAGQQATGAYETPNGVPVFMADGPYLAASNSLQLPMPVFDAGGPVFMDDMGRPQMSMPVSGMDSPPPSGITWDANAPWDNGTYWV